MKTPLQINVDKRLIAEFCLKWSIREFSIFGSALRDDFRPDSDVDVFVSFAADAQWSLFDIVQMQDELKAIFGREVDLIEKEALRNPFRRRAILSGREVLYAA
ncbi:MAG: nucleotidyltransferase family protein [Nitrospirae bacterium]|nr:nucleotidyltransferase family protein [Nitrospirota bacterium]